MNIDEIWLRRVSTLAKAFHGREGASTQNGASNATDDPRNALEMRERDGAERDFRAELGRYGPRGLQDIMAIVLVGRNDAADMNSARTMIEPAGQGLEDRLVAMPLLAHYLVEGLQRENAIARQPTRARK